MWDNHPGLFLDSQLESFLAVKTQTPIRPAVVSPFEFQRHIETSVGNELCRFDSRLRSGLDSAVPSWCTSASLPKGLGPPAEKSQPECAYANHRDLP
jgi:hypothetical protein